MAELALIDCIACPYQNGGRTPAGHLSADPFRMPVVKPSGPVDWNNPGPA